MYQPGGVVANKSVAVSKVFGNTMEGLSGKSMLNNRSSVRKVEGQDFGKTAKSSFEQNVQNLRSKPNQKVLEDEYINVPIL